MSLRPIAACVLLATLVACGHPPAPAYPDADDGFSEPQVVARPGLPDDEPPSLRLQPGDNVTLEILSTETKKITGLVIDARGLVHVPLAGDVEIGGQALVMAQLRLQEAVRKFDRLATVTIQQTGRDGQRATVLGAVNKQGSYSLIPAARVTDLIANAGGPLTGSSGPNQVMMASLDGAVLMRDGKPVPIDLGAALRGEPAHNVYVHPGDHLYVPPALGNTITVLGQVGSPTIFPHREGLRLSQTLAQAGGITPGGDKSDVRVIRGTLAQPRVYQASLRDLVDGEAHDVAMRPGDIVFVSDHFIEDFGEVLGIISPVLSLGLTTTALSVTLSR